MIPFSFIIPAVFNCNRKHLSNLIALGSFTLPDYAKALAWLWQWRTEVLREKTR